MEKTVRILYLYLFSLVGLVLVVIGCVRLIDMGLKAFIFTEADRYYEYPMPSSIKSPEEINAPDPKEVEEYNKRQTVRQRQSEASGSIAMIAVGLPLYLYHWGILRKKEEQNG